MIDFSFIHTYGLSYSLTFYLDWVFFYDLIFNGFPVKHLCEDKISTFAKKKVNSFSKDHLKQFTSCYLAIIPFIPTLEVVKCSVPCFGIL